MSDSLRDFLAQLEASGNLIHFGEELDIKHEVAAAMKYIGQNIGKAVIFDRVKGYNVPIAANLFGKQKFLARAFGVNEEALGDTYLTRAKNQIPPRLVAKAPVQEVIEKEVNIRKVIPVLILHEKDAGAYMSTAVTIAKDPETGIRGMGVHRIQVKDQDTIGIFLATPPLSDFLAKAERLGKPLDIAVALGVSPLVFLGAIFFAPKGIDKFEIAGGFAQTPIELVKCLSVDVEVPAEAEFVLEGQVIPNQREKEGPYGESTGYYFAYDNPVAKIRKITHRAQPIYHALASFSSEEENLVGIMTRPYLLDTLRREVAAVEIKDLNLFAMGGICVVKIKKTSEDEPMKVIDRLLLEPSVKIGVIVDEDVNIAELFELAWAVTTRIPSDKRLIVRSDLPASAIDPCIADLEVSTETSYLSGRGVKLGIDATKPLLALERFEKIDVPREVKEKISSLMIKVIK